MTGRKTDERQEARVLATVSDGLVTADDEAPQAKRIVDRRTIGQLPKRGHLLDHAGIAHCRVSASSVPRVYVLGGSQQSGGCFVVIVEQCTCPLIAAMFV